METKSAPPAENATRRADQAQGPADSLGLADEKAEPHPPPRVVGVEVGDQDEGLPRGGPSRGRGGRGRPGGSAPWSSARRRFMLLLVG